MVMPTPREDQPAPSPRTPATPMAFTGAELLRGGWITWGLFNGLVVVAIFVNALVASVTTLDPSAVVGYALGSCLVLIVSGPISLIALGVGLLLARLVGRAMSHVRSMIAHVAVYTGIGVLIGIVTLTLMRGGRPFDALVATDSLALIPSAAAAVSVPLGWWLAARRALRRDRRDTDLLRAENIADNAA